MNTPKKKRKMVPMYSAEVFFSGIEIEVNNTARQHLCERNKI